MAKKVQFGLDDVVVAPITAETSSTITYGEVFSIPGAVNLTLDQVGENTPFYADNTVYFNSSSNQGYSGTLEMALFNEDFYTKILGMTKDNNGALIENVDDTIKSFALGFRISGDTDTKFWFYKVSAQRPSVSSATIETSKTPQTQSINITATARISDKKVKVSMDSDGTGYNTFLDAVYE